MHSGFIRDLKYWETLCHEQECLTNTSELKMTKFPWTNLTHIFNHFKSVHFFFKVSIFQAGEVNKHFKLAFICILS